MARIAFGFLLGLTALAACAFGYGGFEATVHFVDVSNLNQTLSTLNQNEWTGRQRFEYSGPMWWLGGHGAGQGGVVTFGGSGAVSVWASHADSLGSEIAALRGDFEAGYPYSPIEPFWVRPYVDIGIASWLVYAHSVEGGTLIGSLDPNYSKWFGALTLGATPGVEVMGRLRWSRDSYIGLFAKAGYFIPLAGPEWFGNTGHPDFSLSGFELQLGVRFGGLPYREFRM